MPEPEIARRCPYCGVSIRVKASFCPECGKALIPRSDAAGMPDDAGALMSVTQELPADAPESAATQPLESFAEIKLPDSPAATMPLDSSAVTKPLESRDTLAPPTVLSTLPSAIRKPPMQATVSMDHRAGPPPREFTEEDEPNRVEKFRQISTAVIDEAAYDPSLRFVLVSALLFVLFLLLLLFSELMR